MFPPLLRRLGSLLPFLLALAGVGGCAPGSATNRAASCSVEQQAKLPITLARNFLLVPAGLDGGQVLLVVDTGAEATTVTPAAVDALRLPWMSSNAVLLGVGGAVHGGSVLLDRLQLGSLRTANMALDVGDLPPFEESTQPVAGLLGQDLLGHYDVELDLVRQVMTLYAVPACPGFVPPGYERADVEVLERAGGGLLFTSVEIDGKTVRALVDTGARSSLITRHTAQGLGVTAAQLKRDPVATGRGIGSISVVFNRHRFHEVRIGDLVLHDMTLNVAPLPIAGIDMLLGADWLAGRRVWISRAAGRMFQQ